jgi:hypothetical protein
MVEITEVSVKVNGGLSQNMAVDATAVPAKKAYMPSAFPLRKRRHILAVE